MSEQGAGPGWWRADNGKWYPAEARVDFSPAKYGAATQPGPRWWMAEDGRWYPPKLVPKKPNWFIRWWKRQSIRVQGLVVTATLLVAVLAGVLIYRANQPTAQERVYMREAGKGADLDTGHEICDLFKAGGTMRSVGQHFESYVSSDIGQGVLAVYVNAAVADGSLCPEYAYKLEQK